MLQIEKPNNIWNKSVKIKYFRHLFSFYGKSSSGKNAFNIYCLPIYYYF